MERSGFNNDFYNSYYYANIIDNVLTGHADLIGFISNFREAYGYHVLKPFEKYSAFHQFIAHMIYEFFMDDMYEHDLKEFEVSQVNPPLRSLYADTPLSLYNLGFTFKDYVGEKPDIKWEDIEEYHDELTLTGCLEELFEKLSHEVFYLLFNNRDLLLRFNFMMTDFVEGGDNSGLEEEDLPCLYRKPGTLKRVNIPEWVKKAVYFRDRGHCCSCNKDVSGFLSITEKKHFDHMVPLAQGGLNDVSNIQLLCEECNLQKGGEGISTSNWYERWY